MLSFSKLLFRSHIPQFALIFLLRASTPRLFDRSSLFEDLQFVSLIVPEGLKMFNNAVLCI